MKATTLGSTGVEIPVIGFGAMPLSIQGRPDAQTARRVLHAAIDAGMTLIDTADAYCLDDDDLGHNERLIASVLSEREDRGRVRVATKAGIRRPKGAWTNDGRPQHIREACERSLRALGTERIDLYQFHAPDPGVPFEKSVETFAQLQREGKCRHVGLSNVSVKQLDAASRIVDVVSVQNRLNLFFRDSLENGVAYECERRGITFLAYSPVGGGRLSKKLPRIEAVTRIASAHGVSPFAVAIAWVRSKGSRVVAIPGARSAEHAADSAGAAELVLEAEDLAALDDAEFSRA